MWRKVCLKGVAKATPGVWRLTLDSPYRWLIDSSKTGTVPGDVQIAAP